MASEPIFSTLEQRTYSVDATVEGSNYLGFTNHDNDIVYDGDTYAALSGYTPSEAPASVDLNVDTTEILGMLIASGIDSADVLSGVLDGATFELFLVNWRDPDGDGRILMSTGTIGDVKLRD